MNQAIVDRLDALFAEFPVLAAADAAVSEDEIVMAERHLGLEFVADYRWFVKRYGGAMVGSLPVFGLRTPEVMGVADTVVEVTSRLRAQGYQSTKDWTIVSNDGFGNPIGIGKGGRVFLSDHDAAVVEVASTFEEFLVKLLDERLFRDPT